MLPGRLPESGVMTGLPIITFGLDTIHGFCVSHLYDLVRCAQQVALLHSTE